MEAPRRVLASSNPRAVSIAGSFNPGAAGVAATLDMATVNAQMDNVLTAHALGAAGNAITVAMVGDNGPGVGVTLVRVGTAFTFHFEAGVSTQGAFNIFVNAMAGGDDLFSVTTAGTVATVLQNGRAVTDCALFCDAIDGFDTWIRAGFNTGVAGDDYLVALAGDAAAAAGAAEVLDIAGGAKMLLLHFLDSASTVADMEALIAALPTADFEIVTAGTPANDLQITTEGGGDVIGDSQVFSLGESVAGTAVNAEQVPAPFSLGANPGAVASWAGMPECSGVTHPSVGLYILTFRDSFPAFLDFEAGWQTPNASVYHAQIGAISVANRTIEIRILHLGTGALTDPALGGGERVNFAAMVSLTQAGRMNPD